MRSAVLQKFFLPFVLLVVIVGLQHAARLERVHNPMSSSPVPYALMKAGSLGLDSAASSLLWLMNVTELPLFQAGAKSFFGNLETINRLDPKFSFPYAFTLIALPLAKNYPPRIDAAIAIGRRGVANADPDWRIPFYLAALYQLDKLDLEQAIHYYEITAKTPGVPEPIQKFAGNFGISPKLREETKRIWARIYLSTNEENLKARAKAYIERLQLFDALEATAKTYKAKFGKYPKSLDELKARGMVPQSVTDPLGFPIYFNPEGYVTLNKPTEL